MSNHWLVKTQRDMEFCWLSVNETPIQTSDKLDELIPLVWLKMGLEDIITISLPENDTERYINHHFSFVEFWKLYMSWLETQENFATWILIALSEN